MQKLKLGVISSMTNATHPVRGGQGLDLYDLAVKHVFFLPLL